MSHGLNQARCHPAGHPELRHSEAGLGGALVVGQRPAARGAALYLDPAHALRRKWKQEAKRKLGPLRDCGPEMGFGATKIGG